MADSLISEVAKKLVDVVDVPLCVFDEQCSVVWSNRCARRMLKEHAGQASATATSHPVDASAFVQKRVRKAIHTARSWPRDRTSFVRSGMPNTKLLLFRLITGERVFVVGLFARHTAQKANERTSRLGEFGLTMAESKIVGQLLRGRTAFEIAESNRIALQTVRTHIKHAYSKMGVNCREKLFAKLGAA